MTTGRISKSFGVFNIYSTRSLDCAMFWLRKFCCILFFSLMKIRNFKKSKNQQKNKLSSERKKYETKFSKPKHSAIERSRRVDIKNTKTFWNPTSSHRDTASSILRKTQNWIFRRKSSNWQKFRKFEFSSILQRPYLDDYWSDFKKFWCF